ncbi:unnamed protein product [Pylaiella littoralis]
MDRQKKVVVCEDILTILPPRPRLEAGRQEVGMLRHSGVEVVCSVSLYPHLFEHEAMHVNLAVCVVVYTPVQKAMMSTLSSTPKWWMGTAQTKREAALLTYLF